MQHTVIKHFQPQRWLYFFLALHLILWTVVPALVRYNLPLDSIEGTIWGHQLQWGYDKNPYLNGWLTALATTLDGQTGWMTYLFSQLCVVTCMWAMWRLAKEMLPPVYALISVLLLECIQYFNFHAIDFNDNTLELGLWALTIYYFYQALSKNTKTRENILAWSLTGLFAGLGMMAKYYTLTLIAGMFLFLLIPNENRQRLKTLPPYAGLAVFILICLPHIIWLFLHDFITVQYVFIRGSSAPSWTNRFIYPVQFFWQQIEAFLPAMVACTLLFIGKNPLPAPARIRIDTFNQQFLFYVACIPFLLTILICLLLGTKLRAGWGMPLLSTWGIILIAVIQPTLTHAKIQRFLAFIFILLASEICGYSFSLIFPTSTTSANFPGREIANTITQQWHDLYHTQLKYVGGSRWVGGNISFYSPDHPAVLVELDERRAPWINLEELHKQGAVLVWEMSERNDLPRLVREKFLHYKNIRVMQFNWHRNHINLPPIKIGVVILPPTDLKGSLSKAMPGLC